MRISYITIYGHVYPSSWLPLAIVYIKHYKVSALKQRRRIVWDPHSLSPCLSWKMDDSRPSTSRGPLPPQPPATPAVRRNSENSEKYSHFLSCSPKNSFCCVLLRREPVFYVEFDNNSVYIKKTLWKHILYYLCGYNVCKSAKNNYPSTFLSSSEQLQFKSGTKFCVI